MERISDPRAMDLEEALVRCCCLNRQSASRVIWSIEGISATFGLTTYKFHRSFTQGSRPRIGIYLFNTCKSIPDVDMLCVHNIAVSDFNIKLYRMYKYIAFSI